ncbi:hypothetical protein DV532_18765 [Pseudomonas sp. Leaf58]|uniref:hypothetical protein n=1 Tax=Pseudomonas sp. Leaf58 TaxID=1736226 RepID=UPI0006F7850F|nr:hypothetical protein [Pseudomonas sp. Leaf58]AYG46218.1 hypothetical protein DV532_18765 [Pseudomonas sp. Leaf58]KQN59492.1 hypothetical protein ASF02_21835 [Pseudomonas sp. Leaf58]
MNRTHLEHVLAALLIMGALWGVLAWLGIPASHWAGAAAGIFFFAGREYTQGERNLAHVESVHLANLRWYDGLRIWRWTVDGRLDFFCPLVACLVVALLVQVLQILQP